MLVRLISGHIELNVYYNKFNYDPTQSHQQRRVDDPRPTAACPKCSAPRETIHHMLLECQAYDTARQTMLHSLDRLHPLIKQRLSTNPSAEQLIFPHVFWNELSTKLHTAVWYIMLKFIRVTKRFDDVRGLNTANLGITSISN